MSVFEVRGGNDRRSMIKRYERKSKQEAIRELIDIIHCNWNQIEQLEAACTQLRGLTPELPPRPPEGEGLPRYGLRWNGPGQPLSVPMDDGYWTPWHLANSAADHSEDARQMVPEGWKPVPVEPTPEMITAAEEAYMPFGDMDIALRCALLNAPEPIAYRCHKCQAETGAPEPYKAYVRCANCGAATAATAAATPLAEQAEHKAVSVIIPEPLKRTDNTMGEYGAAMIRGFEACRREVARLNGLELSPKGQSQSAPSAGGEA
ncbi:hypothetical protein [Pseudomonas sp. Ga0074129]|uniref:hypothetical protein n=1 Tax=Pseudomonas sp. Ga0074129 TaxID=1752219 RepID=UPI000A955073|nr:hypothetical protein [Pseudomonas sp. Ga0074129]